MRFFYYVIFIAFLSSSVYSQSLYRLEQKTHNYSGTLVLSLQGGFTIGQMDYQDFIPGYNILGLVEYYLPTSNDNIFGFRLYGGSESVLAKDNRGIISVPNSESYKLKGEIVTHMAVLGGGFTYAYSINDKVFPYVFGGISNIWFNPKDQYGNELVNNTAKKYVKSAFSYDLEFGLKYQIQDNLNVFAGGAFHFTQTDYLDDIALGKGNDFYATGFLGFSISLFGKKDSDGDGIFDSDDKCPHQAEDFDGFQDDDGCPDLDNDGDGIPDSIDKCPNDAEDFDGFQDKDGCPDLDNDGDGIVDSLDKCPNQPEDYDGFQDKDGCPDPDNDGDGIPDVRDKCPDQPETFNGYQDDDGCPDNGAPSELKEITLEDGTTFIGNTSEISQDAYS